MERSLTVQDFERLLDMVASRHRSKHDYSKFSDEYLTGVLVLMQYLACRCVMSFVDAPERDLQDVYDDAGRMVYRLRPTDLQMLSERGANTKVLDFLVEVRCDIDQIHGELRRRLQTMPVGRRVLQAFRRDAPAEAVHDLQAALAVEDLHTRRPEKEDDEDLRSVALEEAVKGYRKLGEDAVSKLSFPASIALDPPANVLALLPSSRWDWHRFLAWGLREGWKIWQPVLSGKTEALPAWARAGLKDHWRKGQAQKRTGTEIPLDEAPRKEWDKPAPDCADAEEALDQQMMADQIYNHATDRWGERGRQFVEGLRGGKTVSEAARSAGISRQTGHKYCRELKRLDTADR